MARLRSDMKVHHTMFIIECNNDADDYIIFIDWFPLWYGTECKWFRLLDNFVSQPVVRIYLYLWFLCMRDLDTRKIGTHIILNFISFIVFVSWFDVVQWKKKRKYEVFSSSNHQSASKSFSTLDLFFLRIFPVIHGKEK